mmetsp:Transcript_175/g.451  ORF Transcript_175/g.451 Transcript_175/m.451 type:complete len:113 (+) Transcript_175:804-1142(+)
MYPPKYTEWLSIEARRRAVQVASGISGRRDTDTIKLRRPRASCVTCCTIAFHKEAPITVQQDSKVLLDGVPASLVSASPSLRNMYDKKYCLRQSKEITRIDNPADARMSVEE